MKNRIMAALMAAGLALSPAAATAQGAGGADLPSREAMEATVAYNEAATEIIIGYINAMSDQELAALLNRIAEDPSRFPAMRDDLLAGIARARKAVTLLDGKAAALPEAPVGYLPRLQGQRDALGPYIEELGTLARRQLDIWDEQMAALDRGDIAAYDALIGDETTTMVVLLEGESALARIQQAAIGESQPQHGLLESIVAQNDTLVAFMRMFPAIASGDGATVTELLAAVEAGVARMRGSVDATDLRIERTCRDVAGLAGPAQIAAAERLCDDLRAANATEGDILAVLEDYADIAGLLSRGEFDEPTLRRLGEAETRIVPLIDRRTAIQQRIVQSGLALAEALR